MEHRPPTIPWFPRRRSPRMPPDFYRGYGAFFVTLVTQHRRCLFGEVACGAVRLSPLGTIVDACWKEIPAHFAGASLGPFVVMPNHVHGIVGVPEGSNLVPIIGSFKSAVSRLAPRPSPPIWQRSFHDHLIRCDAALEEIEAYIAENPLHWAKDPLFRIAP